MDYNPNPFGRRTIDCAVRAVARALGWSWDRAYLEILLEGYRQKDMPSQNRVWGAVLRRNGFKRGEVPRYCRDCYTVADFARDRPRGVYVLPVEGHVVTVIDGRLYDTFNSASENPIFYYYREA